MSKGVEESHVTGARAGESRERAPRARRGGQVKREREGVLPERRSVEVKEREMWGGEWVK